MNGINNDEQLYFFFFNYFIIYLNKLTRNNKTIYIYTIINRLKHTETSIDNNEERKKKQQKFYCKKVNRLCV